jgi:hypothetical protein
MKPERILATVLFTEIVGSTERATELRDEGWGELRNRGKVPSGMRRRRFAAQSSMPLAASLRR